jgi:hypothetical protein
MVQVLIGDSTRGLPGSVANGSDAGAQNLVRSTRNVANDENISSQ